MNEIRSYARLGLVHHMLYPDCREHPDEHVATLAALARRPDIETFDCCLPDDPGARAELIAELRVCGKADIAFAAHFFPWRELSFCTPDPREQARARAIAEDMLDCAAAIGAAGLVLPSGGPAPVVATEDHYAAFADFCRWFCGKLNPHGITAQLEPFDTAIDKKYLYGPTSDCVALIEALRPEVENLGIELDVAHLPLMGETFEGAIRTVARHLKRVHLGNCVLKDRAHPKWGDKHPPIGFPGGEIDVPETAEILRLLLEAGFLSRERRGSLVLEMTPWPGKTVEESIADGLARLDRAWQEVTARETETC